MKRGQISTRVADETPGSRSSPRTRQLIRKLRWIGLEREAEQFKQHSAVCRQTSWQPAPGPIAPIRRRRRQRCCCAQSE